MAEREKAKYILLGSTGGGGGGGGAPTNAQYLVGASNGDLTAERVVTNTSTIEWDLATAAQAKANIPSDVALPGAPTAATAAPGTNTTQIATTAFVTAAVAASQYIDGEVDTYADLPIVVGTPALDSAYLVRDSSGLWLLNRKPAGIYIRTANNGALADWTYAGEFSDIFSDLNFAIYDNGDSTKQIQFQASGITTGNTRVLTPLDKNYTLEETGHASKHLSGGSDAIKLDDLATPDDNTDLNASAARHGLLPKLSGSASDFLKGDGTWGTGSGGWATGLIATTTASTTNITSSVTETSIFSFTLPGGTLGTQGAVLIRLYGQYTNNTAANQTVTIKFKYGTTTIFAATTGAISTSANARSWYLEFVLFADNSATAQRMGGSAGYIGVASAPTTGYGAISGTIGNSAHFVGGSASENSANDLTVDVTITLSTATATATWVTHKASAWKL